MRICTSFYLVDSAKMDLKTMSLVLPATHYTANFRARWVGTRYTIFGEQRPWVFVFLLFVGAVLDTSSTGFHERNEQVAKSDYLIAFSWSEGSSPTEGGTKHTWDLCTNTKIHIPLSLLLSDSIDGFYCEEKKKEKVEQCKPQKRQEQHPKQSQNNQ